MVEKASKNPFISSSAVAKGAFPWFIHQSKEKHMLAPITGMYYAFQLL